MHLLANTEFPLCKAIALEDTVAAFCAGCFIHAFSIFRLRDCSGFVGRQEGPELCFSSRP